MRRIANIAKSRVLTAAIALLLGLATAPQFVFYAGTMAPTKPEAQQGSVVVADNGEDLSKLLPTDGTRDSLLRVCDQTTNLREAGAFWSGPNGSDGYKRDTNGAGDGCGNLDINRNGFYHRTCRSIGDGGAGYGCGKISDHCGAGCGPCPDCDRIADEKTLLSYRD